MGASIAPASLPVHRYRFVVVPSDNGRGIGGKFSDPLENIFRGVGGEVGDQFIVNGQVWGQHDNCSGGAPDIVADKGPH